MVPGNPDDSCLIDVVTSAGGDERPQMPKEGAPLSDDQVSLLRRWIAAGASWPEGHVVREQPKAGEDWWSLTRLAEVRPPGPKGIPEAWTRNTIDRFIYAKLTEKGLRPSPPADRRTLIRRATFDLIGLPPQPSEIDNFSTSKNR